MAYPQEGLRLNPEEELSEHEGKIFPYRRLDALCKIKTGDKKIWLMRHETWLGLVWNQEEEDQGEEETRNQEEED